LPSQDKLPTEDAKVERVAATPVNKQETIDEEGDVSTVESAGEEPVQEENENSDPTSEKIDEPAESTKEVVASEEQEGKEETSNNTFACCHGSPAEVLKNLQAAVGMA
jgi:hypothetical protein